MTKLVGKGLKDVGKNIEINIIDQKTKFEGSIECGCDIRIDGKFKGTLHVKGTLVLGKTGEIDGSVTAQEAIIYGILFGNLKVDETISIGEKGQIKGDLVSKNLEIQKGAKIQAKIQTNFTTPKVESSKKNLAINK